MRAGTLQMRAESLRRMDNWAKIANGGSWPGTSDEVENYMNDLATKKRAGVTTFDRARFAITYAEAAIGKPKETWLGTPQPSRLRSENWS
jgi:hypothetical protein